MFTKGDSINSWYWKVWLPKGIVAGIPSTKLCLILHLLIFPVYYCTKSVPLISLRTNLVHKDDVTLVYTSAMHKTFGSFGINWKTNPIVYRYCFTNSHCTRLRHFPDNYKELKSCVEVQAQKLFCFCHFSEHLPESLNLVYSIQFPKCVAKHI